MQAASYLGRMSNTTVETFGPADVARICEMLFTTAAEGLVVVDASGVILMHNPRLAMMFGYAGKDLLSRPVEVLIPDQMRDRHMEHRRTYHQRPVNRSMGIG